jgi:demethylmenaquinone methyltransferase/2-methoxy-6-polyprenyl-1,4-benzoquinol methylase
MTQDRLAFFRAAAARWDEFQPPEAKRPGVVRGLDLLGALDGRTVVDVGCGTGVAIGPLLERIGGGRIIGIDFAPEMIERARAHHPDARVRFLERDVLAADLPVASIDAVTCFNTFPHFPHPERVILHFSRWLRPGGVAAVWHDTTGAAIAEVHGRIGGAIARDVPYPPGVLAAIFRRHGFDVRRADEHGGAYTVVAKRLPSTP